MKKIYLPFMLFITGLFFLCSPLSANAVKTDIATTSSSGISVKSFYISDWDIDEEDPASSYFYLNITKPAKAKRFQLQLLNGRKKVLKTFTRYNFDDVDFSYPINYNRLYYYRVRIFKNGRWLSWSGQRSFNTCYPYISKHSKYAFNVRMPKVTGVKKFQLFVSSGTGKDKLIGCIKPGVTIKLSKFNGRTLKSYGMNRSFSFYIIPVANGCPVDDYKIAGTSFSLCDTGITRRPSWFRSIAKIYI